jgi:Flp pilus assembly pilin Flp
MPTPTTWPRAVREHLLRLHCRAHAAAVSARPERGASAVEYVLVAAAVLVVVLAAVNGFFGAVANKFNQLTKSLNQ